jgi:uncharacterized protein with NRDE domain
VCLIVFALGLHPAYRLVLAANRDEFHERPSAALAEWPESPGLIAGRDLRGGGTWLGVTSTGRWAAVTNYRDRTPPPSRAISRGRLVGDYLTGDVPAAAYLRSLIPRLEEFDGFNLLAGEGGDAFWLSNRSPGPAIEPRPLEPGVYGLSNRLLDTPWPKVVRGTEALTRLIESDVTEPGPLLDILLDDVVAADQDLPRTGVDRELERALSSAFIRAPGYGTRSSTVLLISRSGAVRIAERRFGPDGSITGESDLAF